MRPSRSATRAADPSATLKSIDFYLQPAGLPTPPMPVCVSLTLVFLYV